MLDYRTETFLTVCKTLNFTTAAKQLHITQPAVSQHIHFLEKQYFKNFMLSRFHIFLFTISSIVMGVELYQYIFLSGENNGVSFLFNSNMSFLVFTNILYVFLIYRYYTYQRLRKFSVIRISKSKYCKFILKIELLIWFIFFVM